MLAAMLDQSADCIKVIGPDGTLDFMNRNGRCAMGIDDFALVAGKNWWDLWPEEAQQLMRDAIAKARDGKAGAVRSVLPDRQGRAALVGRLRVAPLHDEEGELRGLISISRDMSADMRARELRETTAAEMKHRLQNAYALTSAIVMASARGRDEIASSRARSSSGWSNWGSRSRCCSTAMRSAPPTLDMLVAA